MLRKWHKAYLSLKGLTLEITSQYQDENTYAQNYVCASLSEFTCFERTGMNQGEIPAKGIATTDLRKGMTAVTFEFQ